MKHNPTLYIITHCESCFNQKGIFTGRIDSHLTENGIVHAKEMAEQLKDIHLNFAITTSLSRTQETLKYIAKYHPDITVEIDDRFIERDYGALSGKSKAKYEKEHPNLYPLYHRSYDVPPPGGESIQQVEARVLPALKELIVRMKQAHQNGLLICHGNSIRPIIRYFENLTINEMMGLEYIRHRIFHYPIEEE